MLRSIHIQNFKCFEQLDVDLGQLTLLSGVNCGGKSTIIQALVLLSQWSSGTEWPMLSLNGPGLALGRISEIANEKSDGRCMVFGITADSEMVRWTFSTEERQALSVALQSVSINGQMVEADRLHELRHGSPTCSYGVVPELEKLSWIGAEREGPRELFPLHSASRHNCVGVRGELAAGLLFWRDTELVRSSLQLAGVAPTLFHQVRARMQAFFPGSDVDVSTLDGANMVRLRLRSDARSNFHRPQNAGFGLTQIFPIIVAVLAAKEGDILVIENPEVHLHPRAQQDVGLLLCQVAASGVQVILETHSDHVLNAVRLAVKHKVLLPETTAVHFFGLSNGCFDPESPKFDNDGRLDSWPTGFFDQFDSSLLQLL